jgi:hypothetical protein
LPQDDGTADDGGTKDNAIDTVDEDDDKVPLAVTEVDNDDNSRNRKI